MLNEQLDEEMKELVKLEISELEEQIESLEARLKVLLIPKDPNDDKNVIMEIRGAAGGDEAALFAGQFVSDVQPFCGNEQLESRSDGFIAN